MQLVTPLFLTPLLEMYQERMPNEGVYNLITSGRVNQVHEQISTFFLVRVEIRTFCKLESNRNRQITEDKLSGV